MKKLSALENFMIEQIYQEEEEEEVLALSKRLTAR